MVLVHYDDLRADLTGQMVALAARLRLDPPTPDLVEAATFERMRTRATDLAPNAQGVLKSAAPRVRDARRSAKPGSRRTYGVPGNWPRPISSPGSIAEG